MSRPLRIAYGRVFAESNAYSPLPTTRADFERFHHFADDELGRITRLRVPELRGFLRNAELSGFVAAARVARNVECVPLASSLAVSGGPVDMACFEWLRDSLVHRLRSAGPVDGVYLALHGAMQVEGLAGSPEGALIAAVKAEVGDIPIAVSYDLHGNMSAATLDSVAVVEAFKTNPHRDLFQTGVRAGRQLIATLRGKRVPTRAWRKLPMLLGGGITIDFLAPMRPIFSRMKAMAKDPRVMTAHVFMLHPYLDAPDLGWAVHVTTDNDPALANALADELATLVWNVRTVDVPATFSTTAAIDQVRASTWARKTGSIGLVDVGDVVGAGATGGNTELLEALAREGDDLTVYLPIHDPAVVAALWPAAIGATARPTVRGTVGLAAQPAVTLDAVVQAKADTEFGKTILLRQRGLHVAVTERPPYTVHPRFWRQLGLSVWRADAVVHKAFFHYRWFYAASNRKNIGVATSGPTSFDNIRSLQLKWPMWPNQPVTDWRPFDAARDQLRP